MAKIDLYEVLVANSVALDSPSNFATHQNEIRLVGGQHEDGDVVVGQGGDDGLGDFGDADWLRAGGAAAPRHHVES